MTIARIIGVGLLLAAAVPGVSASARPALSEVPEIENTLFAVAVADAVRDRCEGIDARLVKAYGVLWSIRARANELGYSDEEIRAYVDSDREKARMRAKGEAFLAQRGVSLDKTETLCAFGREEIARNSAIGALLKAR